MIHYPDSVTIKTDQKEFSLENIQNNLWTFGDIEVQLNNADNSMTVNIFSPKLNLHTVTLIWKYADKSTAKYLGDHWERGYGDLAWQSVDAERVMPWYFMEFDGKVTNGFGVKTGCNAMCYWQVGNGDLKLTLDIRSGSSGVNLGQRVLKAAEVVIYKGNETESSFMSTQKFCKKMCDSPRLPKAPVYGINDWYFAYGNNSKELILEHTALLAELSTNTSNKPFSVIDAGWAITKEGQDGSCWSDDFSIPNSKFGDMAVMAEKIKEMGMRPGIWVRPLCAKQTDPVNLLVEGQNQILDPTIPENIQHVKNYFELYNQWGYDLVKFDFTTFDILGQWGFQMGSDVIRAGIHFNDNSRTNAEIILDLYKSIREAAGETYIIACNTISHLSAGLFELCRIGDDTSGQEWARTKKMGVNSLAFRGVQHNNFYSADGDCVGLTTKVPWHLNKQWMQLLAESGTPLFISAQPEAVGKEQKEFIKESFRTASQVLPTGEPLDWLENQFPSKWKLNGKIVDFSW